MMAFVDHSAGGTGEPLAAMLRPGRANAATPPINRGAALTQLRGLRNSGAGARGHRLGSQEFLWHIHRLGLSYSVGV